MNSFIKLQERSFWLPRSETRSILPGKVQYTRLRGRVQGKRCAFTQSNPPRGGSNPESIIRVYYLANLLYFQHHVTYYSIS